MTEPPDDSENWESAGSPDESEPMQGQVRHYNRSARVPEEVGRGVFSNGALILTGAFEVVLDFVLRMGEQQRIATRVILPHVVARQFVHALNENIRNFERRFGPMPPMPKPLPTEPAEEQPEHNANAGDEPDDGVAASAPEVPPPATGFTHPEMIHPENLPERPNPPQVEDIYHDLRLSDDMLSGRYANAVLIRHSATEFCFDFITNVYPRSAVSARIFIAAPHILPFLRSLTRSVMPAEGDEDSPEPGDPA